MVAKRILLRKKETTRFSSFWGWMLFGAIVVFGAVLVFHNVRLYQKRTELEGRIQFLHAEIADLLLEEQQLQSQIEKSTSEEYQEKLLREQGLYKKPGEEVVTVLLPEQLEQEEQQKQWVWWNPWTWFSRD